MSISLQKGQKISLTKENAGLSGIIVGLGWDEIPRKGGLFSKPQPIDCDASVIMLTDGKLITEKDLIYFANLKHNSKSVMHMGDNLTGEGEGDDEQIKVDLSKIPQQYNNLVFVVNIYDCAKRNQHFGMIKNAFIRLLDENKGIELCRYNLTEDYANMTAMLFAEIYRNGNEWKFNAMGQGTNDLGIGAVSKRYI